MYSICILDGYALNPGDLDWKPLQALGEVTLYDRTHPDQIIQRAQQADIIISNKVVLGTKEFEQLPNLKLVCVSATGYNNIDTQAAQKFGIQLRNVPSYGTSSVVQHIFAMLLNLYNDVARLDQSVKNGDWSSSPDFCYTLKPLLELENQSIGILGYGQIGQDLAKKALAFGMQVRIWHYKPLSNIPDSIQQVSQEELLAESDIVSINVPLTPQTKQMVNESFLAQMASHAILINTARGEIIHEEDLIKALDQGQIAHALLDVSTQEPPSKKALLIRHPKVTATPHIAWASSAARRRLMQGLADNIRAYSEGKSKNRIV